MKESHNDVVKLRRIFALWTLKESYTKAIGEGLYFDFKRIEFELSGQENSVCSTAIGTMDGTELKHWQFVLMEAEAGYLLATAIMNGTVVSLSSLPSVLSFPSFSDLIASSDI